MASVRLDRVQKVYPGGQVAVEQASFEVADRELMVLVGPSGCGKSTLLRMIAGLEAVTAGTVSIGGRIVNEVAPNDRDIAMVFQSYALFPHLSVAQNIAFGLKVRKVPAGEIERRVHATARTLELESVLDRLPRALSGGQRQRVALARALVREPAVFLLDEPLSNLDARLRQSTRVELARLHRQLGATMIYVTHDQVEAMTLGQRIVVLDRGRIQQIDTPLRLYQQPANRFVAGFLGSPAMNFLPGRLDRDGARLDIGAQVLQLDGASPAGGADRDVVLGVRPEHVLLADTAAPVGPSLSATLEAVEPIGPEVHLVFRCGSHQLIARVAPRPLPDAGARLQLRLAVDQLHFFSAEPDGNRIGPPSR
ncbi:MAG TPA: sn-glycerol-3-phosphate ABC transporter ATP-binding protein UgpC [Burkholderiaceae bacterium]|nr:sn-glycerol-3-phosphate ABC transporter ATP-binding protein UgpC [Burkholderiaceae bacterium]